RPPDDPAGAVVTPRPPQTAAPARPQNRGPGGGKPRRRGGRRSARGAGPARRHDQAKLTLFAGSAARPRHCHNGRFKLAKASFRDPLHCGVNAPIRELTLIITRRAFTTALSLTGLAALAGLSPLRLISEAFAQTAAEVAKPQS